MKRLGLVFLVGVLILSVSVSAADILDSQKQITLVIEQEGSAEFMLILIGTGSDILFTDREIEEWITFGEDHFAIYEYDNTGISWVKITVDVPQDTEVGEYEGDILSNKDYSEITVRVVPPLDEIKSMQDLEVMKQELQAMTDSISGELNDTKENLQDRIAEISQYQQNLTELETELSDLKERSEVLEDANTQLTGQFIGGSSTQFALGIVVGIIIVILFLYRGKVAKAFSGVKKPKRMESEEYKGWKPS